MKIALPLCFALLAATPALATPLTGEQLLKAAGLNPHSTLDDAARLYGPGKPLPHGMEFIAKGSQSDAWLTFLPGQKVYVDCDEAPPALPEDAIGALCRIATGGDWRKSLAALQAALSLGVPTPDAGMPEHTEEAEHAPDEAAGGDDDDDDDDLFAEVARTFQAGGYSIAVETCPRIKTPHDGNWHAGVVITWTPA